MRYIEVKQGKRTCFLTKLRASVVAKISYVAVRGQSDEAGAVQRLFNPQRINRIREFTLQGGDFPNAIILNWVNKTNKLIRADDKLSFLDNKHCAQIIDGQHRMAGIAAAIEIDPKLAALELPVVFYEGLSTEACADIFLAINTEQKPVARSLVFDLYGVTSSGLVDSAALRARDIAMYLHEDKSSPYYGEVKLPGSPIRRGGIALSSIVTAIKPLVEDQGVLEQIGISELERQKKVVVNYFDALKRRYGDAWEQKSNAFLYSSGFVGAMDFFRLRLAHFCKTEGSFESDVIFEAIQLTEQRLITQADVSGLGGKNAAKEVFERLVAVFQAADKTTGTIKV